VLKVQIVTQKLPSLTPESTPDLFSLSKSFGHKFTENHRSLPVQDARLSKLPRVGYYQKLPRAGYYQKLPRVGYYQKLPRAGYYQKLPALIKLPNLPKTHACRANRVRREGEKERRERRREKEGEDWGLGASAPQ